MLQNPKAPKVPKVPKAPKAPKARTPLGELTALPLAGAGGG